LNPTTSDGDIGKNDSDDPILVPILDMSNHRPNQPVSWLTSADKITFVPESSYPPNSEIFNNYGAKPNEERISTTAKANIVLMGYGFSISNNPHDSFPLKLPGNDTVFYITHNNPVPESLVDIFCDLHSEGSIQAKLGRIKKTKRTLYEAYRSLLLALGTKLCNLLSNTHSVASTAGMYAKIYRDGQLELLISSYSRIVEIMDDIIKSSKLLSERTILRMEVKSKSKRQKLREHGSDEIVVKWLCARIHNLDEGLEDEDIGQDDRLYLKNLIEVYHTAIDTPDSMTTEDSKLEIGIQNKLEKKGFKIGVERIRMALAIWDQENVCVTRHPDIKEVIARFSGDIESIAHALEGEMADRIILMED
jgi:hypothetical protein